MIESAVAQKPQSGYIVDSLAWGLYKLGRYEEALLPMKKAYELLPFDPIINDHYGDILWKNGYKIQARYYWNYVLNLKDIEKDLKNNIKNKLISGL